VPPGKTYKLPNEDFMLRFTMNISKVSVPSLIKMTVAAGLICVFIISMDIYYPLE
jgi:hypothetical protein